MEKPKLNVKGIWEIRNNGELIIRFRAYKQRDITLQLRKAEIGLKIPVENLEAVRIADWLD